jgi:hypothetical protein
MVLKQKDSAAIPTYKRLLKCYGYKYCSCQHINFAKRAHSNSFCENISDNVFTKGI